MRRYIAVGDSIKLFNSLLLRRLKLDKSGGVGGDGENAEEAGRKSAEESGLWDFLIQTLLARITSQSSNVVGQSEEEEKDEAEVKEATKSILTTNKMKATP